MTPSLLGRDPDVLLGPGQSLSLVGGPQPPAERAPLSKGHPPGSLHIITLLAVRMAVPLPSMDPVDVRDTRLRSAWTHSRGECNWDCSALPGDQPPLSFPLPDDWPTKTQHALWPRGSWCGKQGGEKVAAGISELASWLLAGLLTW